MSAFFNALRPSMRAAASSPALSARTFSSSSAREAARLILTGRLAAEPELQATASGQEVIKYAVGSSYVSKQERKTNWFRVSSFQNEGPQRDYLLGLPKGTLVYVEGDLSMRTTEDADGKKQTYTNITQRNIEVLKRPFNPDAGNDSYQ